MVVLTTSMSDSSSIVPWVTALLGCAVSYGVARITPRAFSFFAVLMAGAKAFALSIASFFVGSLLHGVCIDMLHRCASHGDENIRYAMGGILAFPAFWLIILLVGKVSEVEPAQSLHDQFESASAAAIMQQLAGQAASTLCPACMQIVAAKTHKSEDKLAYVVTSCKCGKCDRKVRLRPSEA